VLKRTFTSQAGLQAFAAEMSASLRAGDVIALAGPLGSGKTTFVRAVVHALLGEDAATSPTFTFWHRYGGNPPIDHLDLFRIENPGEVQELGLEEAFNGDSIVLIEWWDHAPQLLPTRHTEIVLSGAGDQPRTFEMRRVG